MSIAVALFGEPVIAKASKVRAEFGGGANRITSGPWLKSLRMHYKILRHGAELTGLRGQAERGCPRPPARGLPEPRVAGASAGLTGGAWGSERAAKRRNNGRADQAQGTQGPHPAQTRTTGPHAQPPK